MANESDWDAVKERIRDRIDFVSLVEDYVSLEKRGQNYWALCPFHTEDTPSFAVTPEMGIYKCFGCGKGGDIFDFYMEIEHCEFRESLERLAQRTGIELPSSNSGDDSTERQQMFSIMDYAAEKFRSAFWSEYGYDAREYMTDRGFTDNTLENFDIGFVPDGWSNLKQAMERDNKALDFGQKLGLLGQSDSGRIYDKFRNRIMFPIRNVSGRVISFGGRLLPDDDSDDERKYINGSNSPIFQKRHTFYGLHNAKQSLRSDGYCLVMEGYTDVMMCHQAGFQSAVATLGTALTENHVETLKRYVNEIVLVYDGDESGRQAAKRGGKLALADGLNASVVLLPDGLDPADVIVESSERFKTMIENRDPFFEVFFEWLVETHDSSTIEGKSTIVQSIIPILENLNSEIEIRERISWLSQQLSIDEEILQNQVGSDRTDASVPAEMESDLEIISGKSIEEFFFRSLAQNPDRFSEVVDELSVEDFSSESSRHFFKALKQIRSDGQEFTARRWMDYVDSTYSDDLAGILSWNEKSKFAGGIDPGDITQKIKTDMSRRERGDLARELLEREQDTDRNQLDDEKRELLRKTYVNKIKESQSTN